MITSQVVILILSAIAQYGLLVLGIISAIITIALAYLVFQFGWNRVINDKSLTVGGYYLRNVPFKGYHRFRSKSWNMKNYKG